MNMKWCLIPILLAGCAREPADEGEEAAARQAAEEAALQASLPQGEDPARLQALIDRAIPAVLPNAAKAQYRAVRAGVGGAVCGEVSTGGPYRPFVITPEAVAVVADGPAIAFDDPSDFVADAYIRWCARPEEMERLTGDLARAAAESAATELLPAPPEAPLPVPLPVPAEEQVSATRPPAQPAREAPPPQLDSFFNSVQRQGQ
jgi:8-oxo-dGTP pyrophosphatase MutT (NUDIX family)